MIRNIKLVLEYDGTNYHGWQSQAGSGGPTIQETLEHALKSVTNTDVKAISAGRTDAGVHALGHVVNFLTQSSIPDAAWAPALNHVLPADIKVISSERVHERFHSRFSASGKIYKYKILNRRAPSALHRVRAWHVKLPLNVAHMRRAAAVLVGTHDFSAFRSSACGAATPVRTIKRAAIRKSGDFIELYLEADAFLMHMARNIAGTLVEVGLGRFHPLDVKRMLASRDRASAGRTAPAHGLYLVEVHYRRDR